MSRVWASSFSCSCLRDHADGPAAAFEDRVGEHAHQPNVSAAENQCEPLPGHGLPQLSSMLGINRVPAAAGAAKHT